jgi:mannose-1-phosphate guanylyltransferase
MFKSAGVMMEKGVLLSVGLFIVALNLTVQGNEVGIKMSNVYCVILAGGSGERLWPLSRQSKPKQLLTVKGNETLLDQAINRVQDKTAQRHVWVSTTQQHKLAIEAAVGHRVECVLAEPSARNTAPAIVLCCLKIYRKDPTAVIVFLPADPYIPTIDNVKFSGFLDHALDFVQHHDVITLLGVRPTYPATGYGYIEFDDQSNQVPYLVKNFKEKPSINLAQRYIESGKMLWNIGMFCGKVTTFIDEFKHYSPDIYEGVEGFLDGKNSFSIVRSESIDYAIMEKSKNVTVLPVDFNWCDVGNVEVFLSLKNSDTSNVLSVDAKNNLVDAPGKMVALVGVQDLCVVDTGEVLLITRRSESEKVKAIVKQLQQSTYTSYL